MERNHALAPAILVVFGASGDLTWRKLIPAIYNLYLDGEHPEQFAPVPLFAQYLQGFLPLRGPHSMRQSQARHPLLSLPRDRAQPGYAPIPELRLERGRSAPQHPRS